MLSHSRPAIQPKLSINQPGDRYEQEADHVAEQVMHMPDPHANDRPTVASAAPQVQRACACGGPGGECESCKKKNEDGVLQRSAAAASGHTEAPSTVHSVLRSPGQPLDGASRAFFEPRFGYDFSPVRIHTGDVAARSAQSVNALAYTVGHNVVFGASQYTPNSWAGQRLLAHELAHVVQQGDSRERVSVRTEGVSERAFNTRHLSTAGEGKLQRACSRDLGKPSPKCTPNDGGIIGMQFLFNFACDDLKPSEAPRFAAAAKTLPPGTNVNVHGYASIDGDGDFNRDLSCHRANKLASLLNTARPDCNVAERFEHGAQAGPPFSHGFWRAGSIEVADRPVVPPKNVCGPDATDWFITQVAHAKTNARVLDIKSHLDTARKEASSIGFSSESILEGAVLEKVLDAETTAGSPTRTPEASAQIKSASPGSVSLAFTKIEAVKELGGLQPGPATNALLSLRQAALEWKGLVGHHMPYDFKLSTMKAPKTASCPVDCDNTVTFCPGSISSNCFQTDMPGNLFYAHIGNFVGFTETALQLGSQFAQLTPPRGSKSKASWDPPEDTAMIHFGFGLSNPLTHSDLCDDLRIAKGSFVTPVCADCTEPTTAAITDP